MANLNVNLRWIENTREMGEEEKYFFLGTEKHMFPYTALP